jgi:serine phosphatase RsbU (regulator of sigma subunit)
MPGDAVVAYTDGATEARDARGKFLGVRGIQSLVASSRPDLDLGWPAAILKAVEQYRHGPAADDTLVIEIMRPLNVERSRTTVIAPPKSAEAGPRTARY